MSSVWSIARRIADRATAQPSRPALTVDGETLSYAELWGLASHLAVQLPEAAPEGPAPATALMGHRHLSSYAAILACLTDDVEWLLPGAFHLTGKIAFDREIENDAFVGSPTISVSRMIEERDVVVAEGSVRSARKDGGMLNAVFCDVFEMQGAKIRRLTSYLMEIKE